MSDRFKGGGAHKFINFPGVRNQSRHTPTNHRDAVALSATTQLDTIYITVTTRFFSFFSSMYYGHSC